VVWAVGEARECARDARRARHHAREVADRSDTPEMKSGDVDQSFDSPKPGRDPCSAMTARGTLVIDRSRLTELRAQQPESSALAEIAERLARRSLVRSTVFVEQRYQRRLATVRELLEQRLHLNEKLLSGHHNCGSQY
jgi:hypothetical protein